MVNPIYFSIISLGEDGLAVEILKLCFVLEGPPVCFLITETGAEEQNGMMSSLCKRREFCIGA